MKYPVPDFSGTLKALSGILAKAEAHCVDNKIDPDELLKAQLYPDMFNLIRNVQTSCDTAKGAAARLTGRENPSFEDNETSFADLQARIAKTREFIHSVPEEDFEGADGLHGVVGGGEWNGWRNIGIDVVLLERRELEVMLHHFRTQILHPLGGRFGPTEFERVDKIRVVCIECWDGRLSVGGGCFLTNRLWFLL